MAWVEDWDDEPPVESCTDCGEPGYPDEGVAEHYGAHFLRPWDEQWLCPRCYRNRELERKCAEAMKEK